jgi:hypothetical protein
VQISRQLKQAELKEFAVLYIQSGALQDIAFHRPGGRMSEVVPSQKSDQPLDLEPGGSAHQLTVPTEGSDEFVCPCGGHIFIGGQATRSRGA